MRCGALIAGVGLALLLANGPAQAAVPGEPEFRGAVESFSAGAFERALQGFLAARRAGLDTPALHFNLGATYYRLQRYAEARGEFQALVRDPRWAALAHYNLGLTAQRMGEAGEAWVQFNLAHGDATDPGLRALAGAALQRLDGASLPSRTGRLVSLSLGYDSDPAPATEEALTGARPGGDYFAEAVAVLTRGLGGEAAPLWNAHGALVLRKYLDRDEFDLQGLRAGVRRDIDSGRARHGLGGYISVVYLDGALLEQTLALEAQARARLAGGRDLRGRYELARVDGGSNYGYLGGWRQRLSAEAGLGGRRALWRAGYQLEIEDRRDLRQDGEFFSYSPTRHLLFASVESPDAAGWRVHARVEYRASRYPDPYLLEGGSRAIDRRDDRYGLVLRASRAVGLARRAFVEYGGYRNASTIERYDYRRGQLFLGVELAL